jgi:hypothetical protein
MLLTMIALEDLLKKLVAMVLWLAWDRGRARPRTLGSGHLPPLGTGGFPPSDLTPVA